MSLSSGEILENRYQVLRPLGRGGMGTVYLARDLRFARRLVALKENHNPSPQARVQFRLEAEVLATLRHPHLPAVTDHFTTPDGRQVLVMEFVEGENLEERVARAGPVSQAEAIAWAGQVLDALAYLHVQSPPVIHRDVKPANIRITPEGKAVLVDFGVAKLLLPGHGTATVARAGSPGYAPPEQYAGGTDARSDLYSLGATLYFALTGQIPPEAPLRAAGQTLPPPRRLNPAISPAAEAAILRAMQLEPARRFGSAAEMGAALGRTPSPSPSARQAAPGWRKAIIPSVVLVLALCGLLGWAALSGFQNRGGGPTATPSPTLGASPTVTPIAAPTTIPTAVSGEGRPTSTPMPTPTPTPTHVPPTKTPTPSPTPTPPPPPPPPPPGGEQPPPMPPPPPPPGGEQPTSMPPPPPPPGP